MIRMTIVNSISLGRICCCCSVAKSCLTVTPWTAAYQAPLSSTISWSLFKFIKSIEVVMPSKHLILFHPLLFMPSIFLSIRVFSNKLAFCIRWPKYWSFSFSISPSASDQYWMYIQYWFPLELTGLISLQSKWFSRVFSSTTIRKHQFFSAHPSLWSNFHIRTWLLEKNHSFDYTNLCWKSDAKSL